MTKNLPLLSGQQAVLILYFYGIPHILVIGLHFYKVTQTGIINQR